MYVQLIDHPLAAARLTTMRDENTDNAGFRTALRELTVQTPVATTTGVQLANPPVLVPVLRAGLGTVDRAHALIPEVRVGFVGLARAEATHLPVPYLQSLPADLSATPVSVLATGGSMIHAVRLLAARGASDVTAICALAAPEGVERLAAADLPVRLATPTNSCTATRATPATTSHRDVQPRDFSATASNCR